MYAEENAVDNADIAISTEVEAKEKPILSKNEEPAPQKIVENATSLTQNPAPLSNDAAPNIAAPKAANAKPAAPTAAVAKPAPPPASTVELPSPIEATGDVLVSAFRSDARYGFTVLELRNTSDKFIDLSKMSFELRYASPAADFVCELPLHDFIRPQSYIAFRHENAKMTNQANTLSMTGCPSPNASQLYDREIIVSQNGKIIEAVRISGADIAKAPDAVWERKGWTNSYRSGVFAKDFQKRVSDTIYASDLYELPEVPTLEILEILPNPAACSLADLQVSCMSYVKVKNTGNYDVDLANYRLRSGDRTARDSTIYNVSRLSGVVKKDDWAVISVQMDGSPLLINKDAGTVWFQDAEGLENYANTVAPYERGDTVANRGMAWAYDAAAGAWRWTTPNPASVENKFEISTPGMGEAKTTDLKPCAEGQYRSPETNRCRSIASETKTLTPCKDGQYRSEETGRCRNISSANSTLKPCKDGQYRSEETNRCRSIAAAAAALKPCSDDQFRNPATGRCKKIASTEDILQPCKDGWERNPETNRCRKIKAAGTNVASYPVEAIAESSSTRTMWWALGGLAAAGVGYAVWEWRREVARGFRRIRAWRQK